MASIIDLYVFDLDAESAPLVSMRDVLSSDELRRASKLISPSGGDRFIMARGMLRHVLASYSKQRPADLSFAYGPNGKPYLARLREPLYFNLSHSGAVAAIAVSKDFEVGVDVQVWRSVREGLAERFFSQAEAAALQKLDVDDRKAAFFRCWTRKEAIIKALGEGLSRSLKSFEVSLEETAQPAVISMAGIKNSRQSWSLFSFAPHTDVSGAVACKSCGQAVELRQCHLKL